MTKRWPHKLAGRRSWRVAGPAVAAAAAIAVAAGVAALAGPASGGPAWAVSRHAVRLADPGHGWSVRIPAGLGGSIFDDPGMRDSAHGVRVTNFAPDLAGGGGGTPSMGWLGSFPASGVAVQIWSLDGGPITPPPPLRDSSFPLARSAFRTVSRYVGGREPHPAYLSFTGDGFPFSAAVWIGRDASPASRQAAWAVVTSLRFPALRSGAVLGHTYYVLGHARQYPVGSVTAIPAASLPRVPGLTAHTRDGFFLIHAPRAFYVINRLAQQPGNPSASCALALHRGPVQFSCPGTSLRWNRIGQPLGAHPANSQGLALIPATVAHDGHILLSPLFGDVLGLELRGSPWR